MWYNAIQYTIDTNANMMQQKTKQSQKSTTQYNTIENANQCNTCQYDAVQYYMKQNIYIYIDI